MENFLKASAGVLIAVVLCLVLSKKDKDIALLLTTAVCCMVAGVAISFLSPVIDLLQQLQILGQLDNQILEILLKSAGIGLLAEITNVICADSGNAALGKVILVLSSAVILWLSIPLLNALLELLQKTLGEL